jgi:[protein-PII] uridylyltransferase
VDTIKYALIRALAPETDGAAVANIRTPRQLRHFPLKTTAVISNDPRGRFTELELVAADRNGLLARVGQVFTELGIRIQAARIATLGERVEDIFVITDAQDMPLTDPELCDRLQKTICEKIDQDLQNTSL